MIYLAETPDHAIGEWIARFLQAQATFLNAPLEVERLIRNLTVQYPEDGEGWSLLGELLWHGNQLRGRARTEAREPLERALALDPGFLEPLIHLRDLALIERRHADLRSLAERWHAAAGQYPVSWTKLARFGEGPEAERQQVLAELRAADERMRRGVFLAALDLGPPELLRELLEWEGEGPFAGAPGLGWRMALWSGRPGEAVSYVKEARADGSSRQPMDDGLRLALESRIALLPFRDRPASELARLRTELQALPADATLFRYEQGAADFGQDRLWLLGTLSIRLNDLETADLHARELERLEGTAAFGVAARVRSHSLRALLAREQGRPADALRLLERVEREIFSLCNWCTGSSVRVDFTFERFLRAELLRELGREEEAVLHYPVGEMSLHYPFASISHLRLAEIHARRGEREKAIHHYTFFTLLWRDAEPELRPLVEQAERRLAALRDRGG